MLLAGIFIRFKRSHLSRIHMLGHLICLPLLERKSESLMPVILIICLILVVLDADEVAVYGFGI
jgi:hypothetical protein